MKRTAIFAYSDRGCALAKKIAKLYQDAPIYSTEKLASRNGVNGLKSVCGSMETFFLQKELLIFVGATGIAVRAIAPFVKSKATDPAVICCDEGGNFVISLLSGHIGGANEEARWLAEQIGGTAVVTTATDVNHRFALDEWAAKNGFVISSLKRAKDVAAEILRQDIPLLSDFPVIGGLPQGTFLAEQGETGIFISCRSENPFPHGVSLIPPVCYLGIGCRKGVPKEKLLPFIDGVLSQNRIDKRALAGIASIDLKKEEQGLLGAAKDLGLPVSFYSAEELRGLPGEFSASNFVKSVTGVDNVCERSAFLASGNGKKLVGKTAYEGMTAALYQREITLTF